MNRRILVVVTSNIGADEIRAATGGRFGEDAEVRVLAPASGVSRLQWLANAEDDAHAEAVDRANEVAEVISAGSVQATAGDVDPLLAIDDALRSFPADEIVFVSRTDDEASWLESEAAESARERFNVPLTQFAIG